MIKFDDSVMNSNVEYSDEKTCWIKNVSMALVYAVTYLFGTDPVATGAGGRNRTDDLLITNQLLYRLSYASISKLKVLLKPVANSMQ